MAFKKDFLHWGQSYTDFYFALLKWPQVGRWTSDRGNFRRSFSEGSRTAEGIVGRRTADGGWRMDRCFYFFLEPPDRNKQTKKKKENRKRRKLEAKKERHK